MKRFILIIITAVLLVCRGCTGKSGSDNKLVYWSMWNEVEPQGQVIARAAEAFTSETGIKIEINFSGREVGTILQPALDSGENIDIFDLDYEYMIRAWSDYMLPLDSFITQAYPSTGGRPFNQVIHKTLLEQAKEFGNGSVLVIPYQPYILVVMYNKDHFEKAGIASSPLTWNEMLDACAKLRAINVAGFTVDNAYISLLFGYTMNRLVGLDEAVRMAEIGDFSGPSILRFGEIWENMAKKGYITPNSAANIFPTGQINDLGAGRAAMYLNGTWLPNELKSVVPDFRWGSFAFPAIDPKGDGIETNTFGAQGFAINKKSKYPDEAFRFIAWLTTGEWDAVLAQESGSIPMANDAVWPQALAEARAVQDLTAKRLPYANRFDILPEVNVKIAENFAKLIKGDYNAGQFAAAMRK